MMTPEAVITVREPISASRARALEVQRDKWHEDGADYDEVSVRVIGPKGKIYGMVWLPTADLVGFCRQVIEAYGEH